MFSSLLRALAIVVFLTGFGTASPVLSQTYPNRPIKFIVPYAAGGGLDATARLIANQLGARLGQSVIVENRPGADGSIGTAVLMREPADGYTILVQGPGHIINTFINKSLPYDTRKDFVAINFYAAVPMVLVINPQLPAKTPQELLEYARTQPLTLGAGSSETRYMNSMLRRGMKVDVQSIPYAGSAKATTDVIGGHIGGIMATYISVSSYIRQGTLRAVAVGGAKRLSFLPDVPTLNESIAPGYDLDNWYALFARAGTPKEILTLLNKEVNAVLASPETAESFKAGGITAIEEPPDQVDQRMAREFVKWEAATASAGSTD